MPELASTSGLFRSPAGLFATQPSGPTRNPLAIAVRLAVMVLPGAILLLGTLHTPHPLLILGSVFQIGVCCFSLGRRHSWRRPLGELVFLLYLTGLACTGLTASLLDDWFLKLGQGILLVVSVAGFSVQVLSESGAPEVRRARLLARRLAQRNNWPGELESCRNLPEVKALREALRTDASPALLLLKDPRPQLRLAALAAVEFRNNWQPTQAEYILDVAHEAVEPAVRAAAVYALANIDDRATVERLAEFLSDPSGEVRRATSEAIFWDTERRWPWIRLAVRHTLADPTLPDAGPLLQPHQVLSNEAIKDLTAWSGQKGMLAIRSSIMLAVHYRKALTEHPDARLIEELRRQLADPHAPAVLRTELAHLLQSHHLLDREVLEKLLDPLNPAPLRLIAAEALLATGEHAGAVYALRDIARLTNREIALATAAVVQRRLGVDLGLAVGQPLPPINSRQAAEVSRHVMLWASGKEPLQKPAPQVPRLR